MKSARKGPSVSSKRKLRTRVTYKPDSVVLQPAKVAALVTEGEKAIYLLAEETYTTYLGTYAAVTLRVVEKLTV